MQNIQLQYTRTCVAAALNDTFTPFLSIFLLDYLLFSYDLFVFIYFLSKCRQEDLFFISLTLFTPINLDIAVELYPTIVFSLL